MATNLLGPIRLTAALTPTYCATKAAIHSYTQSLRYQLQATTAEVFELIPPHVATDLLNSASDPHAMPLDEFIAEVMEILKTQPGRPRSASKM
ncbi:MAG TPA: SDR family NAD(P)-dependent oxidoreductase [Bryobacteraceae bacterium]|nr:SDR family NAD(P)-dependent oxidoreductase [Bryobacteraceae bacterium]